jgi:hypothetical protein
MGPNAGRGGPQYDGEDSRLTSKKELSGFYMYGWAAEVGKLHLFQILERANGQTGVRSMWNGSVISFEAIKTMPAHLQLQDHSSPLPLNN